MQQKRPLSKFKSEDEERTFWKKHDSTNFADYRKGARVLFPSLKPSVKTISIRITEPLLESLKMLANKNDVPYQSLIKVILAERVERAFHTAKN